MGVCKAEYTPVIGYHQHTGALLSYPSAGVYHHSTLPICITGCSTLDQSVLLPPAGRKLDCDLNNQSIVEGVDGLMLFVGHLNSQCIDSVEIGK